ncbi:hypothetical protein SAMN05444422_106279 [Halobiforma haloterrestris]|uniref:Uncharacterized protein n=1 Tax=Natronobacterium haloterrestre TaxID=148448 RepID=A0A1I1I0T0_NATHA|nr:hypothetical protein [Halobiforma haloterrestris]SFC30039.1 hypothetical protein SAMN05444422_106279 [Halobiforma haloterrestris]
MSDDDSESRVVAACVDCGSVYAALSRSDGIRPIGTRDGCASCGGTEFTTLEELSEGTGPVDADDD